MPHRGVRLYVVSDIHACEKGWRKMLNAARLRLYGADAVLYAGDLTGKAMVPVVQSEEGFEAELGGQQRLARTDHELAQLEQDIANLGYYVLHTTKDEIGARVAARENATSQAATMEIASILSSLRMADQATHSTRLGPARSLARGDRVRTA